ncbi:STARD3 N-terminal-like protein isoform X1 [Carassius auratus]|uniref:STARD3 N-terminal-like protein isoform X1 n=1 Tax=Carassius auratus TaxID=7957 RepID=A0A6P6NBV2_CARAU|nr:STARD3 N-terminal-like protein isoform X1 [Carassius auratus]XP_026106477.1 STARD3 N-terminal-like protein isoform X1 [Carassius auratus]XP_026143029.1 STARD3 N-terminal-like protein isoform X1 [Carassius auratus]XP_026143039.1 STARD3 N-terminal-like protein isoform X1 [Carassius auratus]XP_052473759.1 STARD3 N-terminal-like protein isoform X1 [Carassius gibelio]XP_052473768.1 STARD3 N-terminal-like protein isoform X1 [Carassius gibelio]
MDSQCSSSVGNINSTPVSARIESYEGEKKCISDVRRTFCLFVTFDLLFVTLLWIIELNVNGGIKEQLRKEVLEYDYHQSFFDIFLLAVFRFAALILAYAVCKLRHWWAIAITTTIATGFLIVKVVVSKLLSQGAFGYLLPIISFILAWIETWLLDFKVLPQEAGDEISESLISNYSETRNSSHNYGYLSVQNTLDQEPLLYPGPVSEGQFYSPPESMADSDEDLDDKHDLEKPIV